MEEEKQVAEECLCFQGLMSNIELARDIKDKKIRYSSLIHSSVCKIL
jgi:hypothetical protein